MSTPILPQPTGRWRRIVYRVGLWLYTRFCARDRHILWFKRPKLFGRAPNQTTVLCRSCVLCGASRADARDMGA